MLLQTVLKPSGFGFLYHDLASVAYNIQNLKPSGDCQLNPNLATQSSKP